MKRIVFLLACACAVLLTGCADLAPERPSPPAPEPQNQQLLTLAEDHASRILGYFPEWASHIGASEAVAGSGYSGRLTRYDAQALAEQRALIPRLMGELETVDRRQLSGNAAVTWDVLRNAYDLAIRQNQLGTGLPSTLGVAPPYVIDQLFGPHIDLPRLLIAQQAVSSAADAEQFLLRLDGIATVLDHVIEALQADAERGIVPPVFALNGIRETAQRFAVAPASAHPISAALGRKLDQVAALDAAQRARLLARAAQSLQTRVYPAYDRLGRAAAELTAEAGTGAGIWRLPQGDALYQLALEAYGAAGMTAEQIHQLGQEDVARIHREMDALLTPLGYSDGTIAERLRALAADPAMRFENSDASRAQIIELMNGYLADAMALAPSWFGTVPAQPIEVKRIPVYEQDAASGAYYLGPSLDGTRPGAMMINLKDTADWPRYTLRSLVHHEAVPGHHFQVSLKQAVTNMPTLRNMMFFSEFGEGWALYAEALAKEMGLYQNDPLGDLGRLRAEVYRAARLVVDTGLHHKRWTRAQAIAWMADATGETRAAVTREIDRYAVWPGQATSYKLGMIKFQQLRKEAQQVLGDRFSIAAFHDLVLSAGSMPMPVLERRVDDWIASQRGGWREL